jgi:hypothetical protein
MAAESKRCGVGNALLALGDHLTRSEPLDGYRAQAGKGGRRGGVFCRDRWSLDSEGGPGMGGMGGGVANGEATGQPQAAVENFHALRTRQSGDARADTSGRANLLNWDGNGRPAGLFPPRRGGDDDGGGGDAAPRKRGRG